MNRIFSTNIACLCKNLSASIERLLRTMNFYPIKQFNGVKVYVLFAFKKIDISCRKVLNKTHF